MRTVADEYVFLLDAVLENKGRVGHGWEGYYLSENGHVSFYAIGRAIGEALVDLGLADDAEPTPFTNEELVKYWGSLVCVFRYLCAMDFAILTCGPFQEAGMFFGTTCRCRAERARELGWRPRYTVQDLLTSIKLEVEYQWKLAQERGGFDFSFGRDLSNYWEKPGS